MESYEQLGEEIPYDMPPYVYRFVSAVEAAHTADEIVYSPRLRSLVRAAKTRLLPMMSAATNPATLYSPERPILVRHRLRREEVLDAIEQVVNYRKRWGSA
jgi:hypothetical protein